MSDVNTNPMNEAIIDQKANEYQRKYPEHMKFYEENSMKSRMSQTHTAYDAYALGSQLEQFDRYHRFCESQGSVSSLGSIPSVALDVITASQTDSILPLFSSVQPIQEESGIVYFKRTIANSNFGNVHAGDVLSGASTARSIDSSGYGAGRQMREIARTKEGSKEYHITVGQKIRKHTMELVCEGYRAIERGDGNLYGNGVYGVVNYEAGTLDIKFSEFPAVDKPVILNFDIDMELEDTLPSISMGLESTPIRAEVTALRSETGLTKQALAA